MLSCGAEGNIRMKNAFVCMVTATFVLSSGAYAGERPLDAGLGVYREPWSSGLLAR